jgi:hypothetical protein
LQMNTFLKVGSLAFNVAQDEKVRELFTMIHQGAKRRGLFAEGAILPPDMVPKNIPVNSNASHKIPFAPVKQSVPQQPVPGGFDISKHLTMDNAKKVLGFAGTIANMLTK